MEATQSGYVALDVAELGAACAGLVVNGCLLWSLKRRQNIPIALLNLTVSQSFVCVLSAAASSAAGARGAASARGAPGAGGRGREEAATER